MDELLEDETRSRLDPPRTRTVTYLPNVTGVEHLPLELESDVIIRQADDVEANAIDDTLEDLGHRRPDTRIVTVAASDGTAELSEDWRQAFLLNENEIRTGPTITVWP